MQSDCRRVGRFGRSGAVTGSYCQCIVDECADFWRCLVIIDLLSYVVVGVVVVVALFKAPSDPFRPRACPVHHVHTTERELH